MFSFLRSCKNLNLTVRSYVIHVWDDEEKCFGVLRQNGKVLLLDFVEAQIYQDYLVLDVGLEIRDVLILEAKDIAESKLQGIEFQVGLPT